MSLTVLAIMLRRCSRNGSLSASSARVTYAKSDLLVDGEVATEGAFAERARIVESLVFIQIADAVHLGLSQRKARQINVLSQSFDFASLRDNGCTALNAPAQDNLSGCFAMGVRDALNNRVL